MLCIRLGAATKQSKLGSGSLRLDCFAAARNDGFGSIDRESQLPQASTASALIVSAPM
jgi:hypothetical protein